MPLALRLFLPERWLEDASRLDKAGVPPSERRTFSEGKVVVTDHNGPAGAR